MPQPKEESTPQPLGESSSKDSEVGLDTPRTNSSRSKTDEVLEMHPYDPHRAAKDVEVGTYYLKKKNYRAALERFNDALLYKPNDGEATFYLGQTQEKLELFALAYQNYHSYLSLVQDGPLVKEAQAGMKRLEPHLPKPALPGQPTPELAQVIQEGEAALAKNDFEPAHESFLKALQIAPDDPVVNFRLAQSLKGLQHLDEARLFYQKYLALAPDGQMVSDAKHAIAEINGILGKT